MSTPPTENRTHPDELLPWLVNNTLSGKERRAVEDHVQDCTRCQQEVALLKNMRSEIQKSPVHSPGDFGLHRLLKEVRQDKEAKQAPQSMRGHWWYPGFAIAASLIIVIQAGLLVDAWFLSKPMVPLAGPEHPGVVLQLSFAPTATEAQIRELLRGVNGSLIDGPGQFGVYRIRIPLSSKNETKIQQTLEFLRQQKDIVTHMAKE